MSLSLVLSSVTLIIEPSITSESACIRPRLKVNTYLMLLQHGEFCKSFATVRALTLLQFIWEVDSCNVGLQSAVLASTVRTHLLLFMPSHVILQVCCSSEHIATCITTKLFHHLFMHTFVMLPHYEQALETFATNITNI